MAREANIVVGFLKAASISGSAAKALRSAKTQVSRPGKWYKATKASQSFQRKRDVGQMMLGAGGVGGALYAVDRASAVPEAPRVRMEPGPQHMG